MSLDTFEQSLLGELRRNVAARTPDRSVARRRTGVRLAVGGLAAAGAATVAVVLGSVVLGPEAAYAVDPQPDGDVVVTIHDLADAAGLEAALAAEGIHAHVTYVPGFSQDDRQARTATGADGADCDIALAKVDGGVRFTLGAGPIAGGSELDIVTSGSDPADVGSPVAVTWSGGSC
jgi:hypothetical protein